MSKKYRFKCTSCDEWHEGIPGWGWNFPPQYFSVPEAERENRCFLTQNLCVVDDAAFYVCGCLEFPVMGSSDILTLRVWLFVSKRDFFAFQELIGVPKRSHQGPFSGILSVPIPSYPETMGLAVSIHIRDDGIRPYVALASTDHPIYAEQRDGVGADRIQALYDYFEHGRFDD